MNIANYIVAKFLFELVITKYTGDHFTDMFYLHLDVIDYAFSNRDARAKVEHFFADLRRLHSAHFKEIINCQI